MTASCWRTKYAISRQILDAGGSELRQQKNAVDRLKKSLAEKSKLVTKLSVEQKSCAKKLAGTGDKFRSLEAALTELKTEYDEVKERKAALEEKAVELMTLLDSKKESLADKDQKYKKLSKTVERSNAEITKLTKQVFEDTEKRKTLNVELSAIAQRMKSSKRDWALLRSKFTKNKKTFLLDDDDDDDDTPETTKDAAADAESDKKTEREDAGGADGGGGGGGGDEDNAMDVDSDDAGDADGSEHSPNGNENEEKALEPAKERSAAQTMSVDVYVSENTLKFVMLAEDQMIALDLPAIDREIEDIKAAIDAASVNMGAIDQYRMKDDEYVRRLQDLQSCKEQRDAVRQQFEDCKKARFDSFMAGFSVITKKLKEMYRMLTCGGDAELELVDSIDPFSEGVQFSVRPPKKSWKNISNLSGGEKTLSSMALVFALHHYKPTPLYVMDEIDAALDFKNVSIVANYIHQRTKNAQFVIISLRNNMFELANRLVGIYKTNNASKSITIDPELFKLPGAAPPNGHHTTHSAKPQGLHHHAPHGLQPQPTTVSESERSKTIEDEDDDDVMANKESTENMVDID